MKCSFFKLPLFFTFAYFVISLLIMLSLIWLRSSDTKAIVVEMLTVAIGLFFIELPKLLLLIVLSSFALYRYTINMMTTKNMLLVILLAIIMNGVVLLFNMFITPLFIGFYVNYVRQYYDPIIMSSYHIVLAVLKYIIVGLVSYAGIAVLKNQFNNDINLTILPEQHSAKIHLTLFLLLFISIFTLFLMPILLNILESSVRNQGYIVVFANLFSLIIAILLVFLAIKSCFNYAFSVLQTAKIVKTTIFVTIASMIVNIIVFIIMILVIKTIPDYYYYYYFNQHVMLLLVLLSGLLPLLLTCGIARVVTKRYFSSTFNATA